MTYLNKVVLIGRVQDNIELVTDGKERKAVSFYLIVKDFTAIDTAHYPTKVLVKAWDSMAEYIYKKFKKDTGMLVDGILKNWHYTGVNQLYVNPIRVSILEGIERDKKTARRKTFTAPPDDGLYF